MSKVMESVLVCWKRVICILPFVGLTMLLVSCTPKEKNKTQIKNDSVTVARSSKPKTLELVAPPKTLVTPEERADFLVRHYWDNFDFLDTTYIHFPEITEQAMADYVDLFSYTGTKTVDSSIGSMLDKAEREPKMYNYFVALFKKYLYDPNSPLRNEEYYLLVLGHVLKSEALDAAELARLKFAFEMLQKNRVGEGSTDFTYTLASGKTGTLYGLKSAYTLLLFYNPDCHSCEEIMDFLKSSSAINQLLSAGRLVILAVYPDENLEVWKKHLSDIPDSWINSYDDKQILEKKKMYDLKAIPTIYLLDEHKNVLLKDATTRQVEQYLWEISSR